MLLRLTFAVTLAIGAALADQITIGDFSSPTVDNFDAISSIFTSDCGGHPCVLTPVVIDGNTYTTSAGDDFFLRYLVGPTGNECLGGSGGCLNTNSDLGFIDIVLGTPMQKVGVDAETFGSFTVDFYATDDVTLLGTASLSSNGFAFGAWADTNGIGRIRITDTENNITSMIVDNLTVEGAVQSNGTSGGSGNGEVPEPSSAVWLGIITLAATTARRWSRCNEK